MAMVTDWYSHESSPFTMGQQTGLVIYKSDLRLKMGLMKVFYSSYDFLHNFKLRYTNDNQYHLKWIQQ